MNISKAGLTAIVVATLTVSSAMALPLTSGGTVFTSGTTFSANPALGGVVRNDNLLSFYIPSIGRVGGGGVPVPPFSGLEGMIQNRVVESSDLGTLIFAPRIRDTIAVNGTFFEVRSFEVDGYAGFDVDVDFRTDGLGDQGFSSVSRSADGDVLTFQYDDPIRVDQSLFAAAMGGGRDDEALFPSILTDATEFDLTGSITISGVGFAEDGAFRSGSVTIGNIAVPVAASEPVPEPASILVWCVLGACCLVGYRKRKTR